MLLSVSPRIDRKTIYFLKTLRSFWGGNELFLLPWKCFPPVLIAKLSILGKSFDHSRVEMSYFNYFGSVFKCFPPELIEKLSIFGMRFDHSGVEMSYFNYFGSAFKCFPPVLIVKLSIFLKHFDHFGVEM